jgi:hypothetical protein
LPITRSCIIPRLTSSASTLLVQDSPQFGFSWRLSDLGTSIIYESNGADENAIIINSTQFVAEAWVGQTWGLIGPAGPNPAPACCDLSPLPP